MCVIYLSILELVHFLKRDNSLKGLDEGVVFHREHAFFAKKLCNRKFRRLGEDDVLDIFIHFENFHDGGAASDTFWTVRRRRSLVDRGRKWNLFFVLLVEVGKLPIDEHFDAAFD